MSRESILRSLYAAFNDDDSDTPKIKPTASSIASPPQPTAVLALPHCGHLSDRLLPLGYQL